jgi:hypothetical protein
VLKGEESADQGRSLAERMAEHIALLAGSLAGESPAGAAYPTTLVVISGVKANKRAMSVSARRKIAAFQRARWAKVKAQQQKAA